MLRFGGERGKNSVWFSFVLWFGGGGSLVVEN
jgi:hypothetical protein